MINDRNLKIGVISSIVATFLFIYFLDPLLRFVTFLLFKTFGSIAQGYTDMLFEQAALLTAPDPSLFLLSMVTGITSGISMVVIIFFLFLNRPSEVLQKRIRRIRLPKSVIRWGVILLALFMLITPMANLYSTMFQLRITTSFIQHIVLLAPYISDQEAKLLRSRWTLMKSEKDYETLYQDLNKIAKKNEVVLPVNKVFSLTRL
ncbi:MAG: hypothetical protein A2W27_02760 [Deltaproteobacteria bacterium RBG_16_44_11]|nr:MAG: hypothetical protein A2W27_02760 [Deltaproteobacteria bacterium RBG_16_44_11]